MKHDEMVVERTADEPQPAAFNLVDRGCRVALLKQVFAGR
jgi:hypothetical protein